MLSARQVKNSLDDLPASPQPDLPGIKELLQQLARVIEADDSFKPEDQAKALKQVETLAEAGINPEEESNQAHAKSAISILQAMMTELPKSTTFIQTCYRVLPQLSEIFG